MDATMENKMGLPPPYEVATANPPPPPGYFSPDGPPQAGFVVPTAPVTSPSPAPPTTVVTSARPKLGPGPTGIVCPQCRANIVTRVDYTPNDRTHIVATILCAIGSCCCLCCVPYCMPSCRTANHYCPQCTAFVGSHKPR